MDDPETEGIILVGEIGGVEEEEAADYLASAKPSKPVVALVVGRHAQQQRRMGHAGTLSVFGSGNAESKIAKLKSAGALIAHNVEDISGTMKQALAN